MKTKEEIKNLPHTVIYQIGNKVWEAKTEYAIREIKDHKFIGIYDSYILDKEVIYEDTHMEYLNTDFIIKIQTKQCLQKSS